MSKLFVDDGHRQAYVVVEMCENDLNSFDFRSKDEALEYVNSTEYKCYIICVEYEGGGYYKIDAEPHT